MELSASGRGLLPSSMVSDRAAPEAQGSGPDRSYVIPSSHEK